MKTLQAPPFSRTAAIAALLVSSSTLPMTSGCSSPQGTSGGSSLLVKKCQAPDDVAPELKAPETIELPKSRIWIHSAVPTKSAVARIAEDIPRVLAHEKKRDVGAPGKATYKVTRGTPTLHQLKNGIEVRVPVSANISVCKNLGIACVQYGSCRPKLEARFSVANRLGANYEWDAPQGSISATKRCVIGLDVTKQIERLARKEVAKVEAQMAKQWPRVKPSARRLWKEFAQPIAVDSNHCVNMAPEKLAYLPPRIEKTKKGKVVRTALGVTGQLLPAESCKKRKPGRLPGPKVAKKPPTQSRLWFPEVLTQDLVRRELQASIGHSWGEEEQLDVQEVQLGKDLVALRVSVTGSICGDFWITASLSHTSGHAHLGLVGAQVVGTDEPNDSMSKLLHAVEEKARVSLTSAEWFSQERMKQLKKTLTTHLPQGVNVKMRNLEAGDARVVVAQEGVYVLHPLKAKMQLTEL